MDPANPLIVQSDGSILLEVASPRYVEARDMLARFAELEKSPEYIHTYRVTPLSLWNAASAGLRVEDILDPLAALSKYPIPENVLRDIREYLGRYGRVQLIKEDGELFLVSDDLPLMVEIAGTASVKPFISATGRATRLRVRPGMRGQVKQALVKIGYPVEDLAGYVEGEHLDIRLARGHRRGAALFTSAPTSGRRWRCFTPGARRAAAAGASCCPAAPAKPSWAWW